METIKRIIGAFLILTAIAIVAQAVIPGGRDDLWTYVNPLMAVSVLLVVAYGVWSGAWRTEGSEDAATRALSESRLVFFAALFFAYLFFLNWFKELDEGGYSWVWIVLNGTIPVLNVWTGIRLWTAERG